MKLLLIVPNWKWCEEEKNVNYPYPPYNLCLLAAIVRNKKLCSEISVVDCDVDNKSEAELRTIISEKSPDVVGTTVLMDQLRESGHIVTRIAKEVNKDIVTIMGGVYPTVNPHKAMDDPNLDMACVGEGEYVFPELLEYIKGDRKSLPLKGVIYRDKDSGKNIFNARADFVRDMDILPTPAWDLINFDAYSRHVAREFSPDSPRDLPYIRLYTSRGCPFSCSFCQVPLISGHDVRRQSPKKVLDELEFLKKTYGIKSFMNSDDNFLATKRSTIREFLQGMVDRKLDMPWTFEDVGVMHLNEETVRLLAASNCKYMGYAVETGVERISKDIIAGKPLKKEHTKKMMKLSKELGIFSAAAFIIGFPSETWDEIRETIRFAEELDADYTRIHILVPLKGTKMYEIVEEEGLLNEQYDHFNNQATWKSGVIESQDRAYTSNDLTILKAMEWDRINFTNPEKRKRICDFLKISDERLMERRRETINNIYKNLKKDTGTQKSKGIGRYAATFERVDAAMPGTPRKRVQ